MARKKEYWDWWNHVDDTPVSELAVEDEDEDDVYGEYFDEIPEGCNACGNPDYPKCKYSCPMFDI